MPNYRLKKGAPDHYVQGYGLVKAGATFAYDGPALSEHCEEIGEDEPVKPPKVAKEKPKGEAPDTFSGLQGKQSEDAKPKA